MDANRLRILLDLTAEQSQVLAQAHQRGSLTGPGVAVLLGKARSHAYVVLRSLVTKGLLTEHPGRPLAYYPRPVRDAIADRQAELEAKIQALRSASAGMEGDYAPPMIAESFGPNSVAVFSGFTGVGREAGRLMAQANSSVVLVGYPMREHEALVGIMESIHSAMNRGVDVRLYARDSEEASPTVRALLQTIGIGRIVFYDEADLPNMGLLATDQAALFLFAVGTGHEGSDQVIGIRITASELASFMHKAVKQVLHQPMPARSPEGGAPARSP